MKRLFDILILLSTSPLWLSVIILSYLINVLLEGFPGFYKSNRFVGNNKYITVRKFRVMKKNIDKILNRSSLAVENQVFLNLPENRDIYTRFGLKLERFGITEIPQFLSVIKDDMSIIGARPLPRDVIDALVENFPDIALKRFNSKCGLTGLPQLIGRDFISDEDRLRLEVSYANWAIENYNPIVDFKILLYTVLIVLGLKKRITLKQAFSLLK